MDALDAIGQNIEIQRRSLALIAERSLASYVRQAWPIIEPSTRMVWNWHLDAKCEHLEAVTRGQIRRLIINEPPRVGKSVTAAVMWPTWDWTTNPERRFMFVSYSSALSTKHSVDRRTVIQSDWYQRNWGGRVKLSSDQNVKNEFQNTHRGVMVATSVGGSATGKGGDVIVVDDPLNPQEAQSDIERERANTFFDQTVSTRLDDPKTGAIVVIQQRLHERDLTGHLLAQGGWEHLRLPMRYES